MTRAGNGDRRQRILFLSTRFPFPLDTGGKIRTANVIEQLSKRFSVTVVSNVVSPRDDEHLPRMRSICDRLVPVPWREPEKFTIPYYWKILRRSFSRYPVTVLNDYSPAVEEALRSELAGEPYDLLLCDFVQSAINIPSPWTIPVLVFQHNVEATILERHHRTAANPLMRLFWRQQHARMVRFEGDICRRSTAIIAVSDLDRERMIASYGVTRVESIPTGVDTAYFTPIEGAAERERLVFVGSMDWEPNDDAMGFFLDRILPLVRRRRPRIEVVIVGRNPSPRLRRRAAETPGVTLTGRVEDTRPFIAESAVFIVPIRIGGGTRMKIYEAMAMERAVVSTTVGAEGLPLTSGEHLILADKPESFAAAVADLLDDRSRRRELARRGRSFVLEHFGWERVGEVFSGICERAIDRASATVP